MRYFLMHRYIEVAEIDIDTSNLAILDIIETIAPEHLPVGIVTQDNRAYLGDLLEWWLDRSIPNTRSGIAEALYTMKMKSPLQLLIECLGLSLTDQYWINPVENPLDWSKINFFTNDFSSDVGNILFGKAIEEPFCLFSPDNTTDGWLQKKWILIDGKHYLVKGGSYPHQQEPFNEVLATAISRRLDIDHVPYTLTWENGLPFSVCEDIITSNTDMVSAWQIIKTQKKDNKVSPYQHFINCCEGLGIPNVQTNIDKMLVLDYLIANVDRHYNNFCAIREACTLEWIGLAPIFDNGTSMWHDLLSESIQPRGKAPSKPFRSNHEKQIGLVKDFSWIDLTALEGLEDEFYEILLTSSHINDHRRTVLCSALKNRIGKLQHVIN